MTFSGITLTTSFSKNHNIVKQAKQYLRNNNSSIFIFHLSYLITVRACFPGQISWLGPVLMGAFGMSRCVNKRLMSWCRLPRSKQNVALYDILRCISLKPWLLELEKKKIYAHFSGHIETYQPILMVLCCCLTRSKSTNCSI